MSRQRGNRNENEFMALAEEVGYATFAARGSRGPVDVLCFTDYEHYIVTCVERRPLVVQVGTTGKPIRSTLEELDRAQRPVNSLCVVARRCKRKNGRVFWKLHTVYGNFDSLEDALKGME